MDPKTNQDLNSKIDSQDISPQVVYSNQFQAKETAFQDSITSVVYSPPKFKEEATTQLEYNSNEDSLSNKFLSKMLAHKALKNSLETQQIIKEEKELRKVRVSNKYYNSKTKVGNYMKSLDSSNMKPVRRNKARNQNKLDRIQGCDFVIDFNEEAFISDTVPNEVDHQNLHIDQDNQNKINLTNEN